ncbi:MAG: glycyl radical protein [Lachnospiraceae bacterium]|nr:glycyl radical protein [Lachnospiraceae bacterium]MDD7051664.1 glycyl radical protein [Lachnospiraceae bacterium]MDY4096340.1 glycyl radical protein [Lachnospiraceae bacterium]
MYNPTPIAKSERIKRMVDHLFAKMPEIEAARAQLITQSYQDTEGQPTVIRKAKAFEHILKHLPIIIRPEELIVGSTTLAPRGCQTYPEFSYEWLEAEFDTVATRSADPFYISEDTKKKLKEANAYWKGKTTSELATSYMAPETLRAMEHNFFTPGNYFYNGVGHVTVHYDQVLELGLKGIKEKARKEMADCSFGDANYAAKMTFLEAVLISCDAVITYAKRYAVLAASMAERETNVTRKKELLEISRICDRVPENPAQSFQEACQSFWFIQQLLQVESSGHSISPGRFDQYMYPFYEKDILSGKLTREDAQELIDCIWVKLNDLNKCRDAASAEGFAGYSLFQNLIVGGQTAEGRDATNDLSFMCITASEHVFLPQPSLSIRVWNGSSRELLMRAAQLTRTGIGLPAYYNDEVIIPALVNRGISMEDARNYNIIGCVEPQVSGKTDGWHDAAFFNMCRPLEMVFSNGYDRGELASIQTGDVEGFRTFEEFYEAYRQQMEYNISLLVNADNAIDKAHATLCPLPFESCLVEDCMKRGISAQEGGAIYNFTGPQGFGIANVADSLYTVKKLVFEEKKVTMGELKRALEMNYGKGFDAITAGEVAVQVGKSLNAAGQEVTPEIIALTIKQVLNMELPQAEKKRYQEILDMIDELPKFGNDIDEVDTLAREAAYLYTRPLEKYTNPRGGSFQAGLYPVSANVPLGAQTGATPDGRLAHTPVADGVSPTSGRDVNGPTAACNSVAKLDHAIASNGTLFNMKMHPTAMSGQKGLENFISLIRGYFDQKGMHMQFNVVDRQTLLEAQKHPEKYSGLVVRVAGYSALFTTLSKSLQDDIIRRTEQAVNR